MKRIIISVILIVVIILSVILIYNFSKKEEELTVVRLNEVVHSIFYAPQYVAIEKGFFEEEGLKIDLSVRSGC